MRETWINIGLIVLSAIVLSIPAWLPRWSRWVDTRNVRRANARALRAARTVKLHSVRTADEDK